MNEEKTSGERDLVTSLGQLQGPGTPDLVHRGLRLFQTMQPRIVRFHKDHSIGWLSWRDADVGVRGFSLDGFEWKGTDEAKGNITVPPGKKVKLQFSLESSELAELFSLLPGDLTELEFEKSSSTSSYHFTALELSKIPCLNGLSVLRFGHRSVWMEDVVIENDAFDVLNNLSSLIILDLSWAQFSEHSLNHLRGLTSLEGISLHNCQMTGEGLDFLKYCPFLMELDLSNTKIESESLKCLTDLHQLEKLDLSQTAVDDTGLDFIRELTMLRELDLSSTQISDFGLQSLQKMNTLQKLNLNRTGIRNKGIHHLKIFDDLEELDLSHTQVGDASIESLDSIPNLQVLNLAETSITDESLAGLDLLKDSLRVLDLSGTKVTNKGLLFLKDCFDLESVDVTDTLVTAAGLEQVKDMHVRWNISVDQLTYEEFLKLVNGDFNGQICFGSDSFYEDALQNEAKWEARKGQLSLVESHLKEVIRICPDDNTRILQNCYVGLSLIYHRQGRIAEAFEECRKVFIVKDENGNAIDPSMILPSYFQVDGTTTQKALENYMYGSVAFEFGFFEFAGKRFRRYLDEVQDIPEERHRIEEVRANLSKIGL